ADGDVARGLLEDGAALILCQAPPGFRLADRNEGGEGCTRAPQAFLLRGERGDFGSRRVARIAGGTAQGPDVAAQAADEGRRLGDHQTRRGGEAFTRDGRDALDAPGTGRAGG